MCEAGALVLLPFPFSDLSSSKRRPVVALTAADARGDFVACPVTSRAGWPNARRLLPENLVEGMLPLASWVRTDKVVTLHTGLIVRQFGRVADQGDSVLRSTPHFWGGGAAQSRF
jgi:mRNA interferase MazF